MPDRGIDGSTVSFSPRRCRAIAIDPAEFLGIAGENPRLAQPPTLGKCEEYFAFWAGRLIEAITRFFTALLFLRHDAQIVSARPCLRPTPSCGGRRRLPAAGTRSHDALHHRDEPPLLGLAQIRHGLAVGGPRRRFHPAQQACSGLGQPAHLRPAIPAINGAFDKFTGLQALKGAGGRGAIEGYIRRQRGLVSGSAPGQRGKKTILQRGDIKGGAFFLEQRDMDLMQAPDQKPRPLPEWPGIAALVHCFPGHL